MTVWFYCGPHEVSEERIQQGFKCCPRCGVTAHDDKSTHPRMRVYIRGVWPIEGEEKGWR